MHEQEKKAREVIENLEPIKKLKLVSELTKDELAELRKKGRGVTCYP